MDWRHLEELYAAARGRGLGLLNLCVTDATVLASAPRPNRMTMPSISSSVTPTSGADFRPRGWVGRFARGAGAATTVVRIFPNEASCLRLVRALAVEAHEAWLVDTRYLNMEHLKEHKKETLRALAASAARRAWRSSHTGLRARRAGVTQSARLYLLNLTDVIADRG